MFNLVLVGWRAAQEYFVSSSGNDNNDGMSSTTPWKTITKVNASVYNGGAIINFDASSHFVGQLLFNATNCPSGNITLRPYNGTRWELYAAGTNGSLHAALTVDAVSNFTVRDAYFNGGGASVAGPAFVSMFGHTNVNLAAFSGKSPKRTIFGIWLRNSGAADCTNMLIENVETENFNTTNNLNQQGAHIWIVGYGYGTNKGWDGITIKDCKLHGSTVESHDDCGIQGYGLNRNIKNVLVDNCEIYNMGGRGSNSSGRGGKLINFGGTSGDGIITNGWNVATIKNCYAHDIGANLDECGGPVGIWGVNCKSVYIHENEIARIRSTIQSSYGSSCDFAGMDWDISCEDCLGEWNYTHDNDGPSFIFFRGLASGLPWQNNHFRFNVSVNDAMRTKIGLMGAEGGPERAYAYNNTFLQQSNVSHVEGQLRFCIHPGYTTWRSGAVFNNVMMSYQNFFGKTGHIEYTKPDTTPFLNVHDNIYQMAYEGRGHWNEAAYDTNAAYQALNTGDNSIFGSALLADETFTAPTLWPEHPGPGNPTALEGLKLQSDSPARYVGADIATVIDGINSGDLDLLPAPITTDFWGETVSTISIGAHCPAQQTPQLMPKLTIFLKHG